MITDKQPSAEQAAIISSEAPAIVVTAGAGSGKTEVLARRVARILADSPDESFRVLAVTYTVKAADEMEARLRQLVVDVWRVDIETVHAFAHRLIRQHGTWDGLPVDPEVLDRDEDRVELLATWLGDAGTTVDGSEARKLLFDIDLARARCSDAPHLSAYRAALTSRGALDYASMLEVATRLLHRDWVRSQLAGLYRHLVIDEAQNLSPAQYALLTALLGPAPSDLSVLMVGDPKQSIVQFAGADPHLVETFATAYDAKRLLLSKNFRSAEAIVALAGRIGSELGETALQELAFAAPGLVETVELPDESSEGAAAARWVKGLLEDGLPTSALAEGETGRVAPEDIAVLARTAATLRWTVAALDDAGIAYVVGSGRDDWLSSRLGQCVADLIAFRAGPHHPSTRSHLCESSGTQVECLDRSKVPGFAALAATEGDFPAELFARLPVSLPLSDEDLDREDDAWRADRAVLLLAWRHFSERTPARDITYANLQLHIARTQRVEATAPGVRLLTVHKSQGREFRAVCVTGLNQGQFPDFRQQTPADRRAELHCFYVAVTRASRLLRLSRAQTRSTRYGPRQADPSEYLAFTAGLAVL
jgi:DNA helicase-2/ATP-dependent DNA helicase PcrA